MLNIIWLGETQAMGQAVLLILFNVVLLGFIFTFLNM